MGTYYANGLILMHQDFREADRLVTVYTKEYGKLKLLARGVRKVSSKLAGSLEPYSRSRLHIVRGRQYDTVAASDVERIYYGIMEDLKRTYLAGYFASVIEFAIPNSVRDENIYSLIEQTFSTLEHKFTTPVQRMKLVWFFVWQLLGYLGYAPELHTCIVCKESIPATAHTFNFSRGGIICSACADGLDGDATVTPNSIKVLRIVSSQQWNDVVRLRVGGSTARKLTSLTEAYLTFILERHLPLDQFFVPE